MDLLNLFKTYLFSQDDKPSKVTVKNYLSDINHFVHWYETTFTKTFNPTAVSSSTLNDYRNNCVKIFSPSSLDRHFSTLRKFFKFLLLEGKISINPFEVKSLKPEINSDPWRIKDFKDFLYVYNASRLTIKNYLIDIKQFLAWAQQVTASNVAGAASLNALVEIDSNLVEEYKQRLLSQGEFSPATINRKLSSLRKYLTWAASENLIGQIQDLGFKNLELTKQPILQSTQPVQTQENEANRESLIINHKSDTAYSGFPPLRLFQKASNVFIYALDNSLIVHLADFADKIEYALWKTNGQKVFTKLKTGNLKPKNLISSFQILNPASIKNLPKSFYAPLEISTKGFPWYKKAWINARYNRPQWYKTYHSYPIVHYLHFAVLIIFLSVIGFGFYNTFFAKTNQSPTLAVGLPVAPPRVLSFQGRLTDNFDTPISTPSALRFAIYNSLTSTNSALLWQEVDFVTPDQDGIFNVILGDNTPIPATLFTSDSSLGLWLGVTVGTTDELTPRQQLATVAFATNSETLQGLVPITAAGAPQSNVVLALDSAGNLTIGGSATPTFQASGGQFTLSGQGLLLTTNAGTNSNVALSPDGLGQIDLQKPLVNTTTNNNLAGAAGAVEIDDTFGVLATSSATAFILNQDGAGSLIAASSSGNTKFTVDASGNLMTTGTTTFGGKTYTWPGSIGGNNYVLQTQTDGTLAWINASGLSTKSFWQELSGALSPVNTGDDFLLGSSSTGSAVFAFTGLKGNQTQASLSGQLIVTPNNGYGGGIQLGSTINNNNVLNTSAAGGAPSGDLYWGNSQLVDSSNISSFGVSSVTNSDGTLTISPTTGAVVASLNLSNANSWGGVQTFGANTYFPNNGIWDTSGNVGVGTTSPLATFDVRGNSGTTPAASVSANTSFATLVVNNDGAGDLFTASASGWTRFVIDNNGNLTASGNGNFAGNLTAGGTTTFGGLTYSWPGSIPDNNYVLRTQMDGTLAWVPSGSIGTNFWQDIQGALSPIQSTDDLLLGSSSTSSAAFAFTGLMNNVTGGNHQTQASLSGQLIVTPNNGYGGGVQLGATISNNNVLNTTAQAAGPSGNLYWGNRQLVDSSNISSFGVTSVTNSDGTLNITPTTGTVVASLDLTHANSWSGIQTFTANTNFPSGVWNTNGSVGIGTINPLAMLDVRGNSGTTPVASFSGNLSVATLITNNDGVGDLFTASSSGWTKFTIKSDGTLYDSAYNNSYAVLYSQNGTVHQTPSSGGLSTVCLLGNLTWGACGSGTSGPSLWSQNAGLLYPTYANSDLALGGSATGSAVFEFLNILTGTPTFNIWNSASQNSALTFSNDGTNGSISVTGPSAGMLELGTAGGSLYVETDIQNDTNNFLGAVQVTDRLKVSANDNSAVNAAMIVDNLQAGDLFTASASGTTRFVIQNNGSVGIGTPSAQKTLDVRGNASIGPITNDTIGDATGITSNLFVGRAAGDYGPAKAGIYAYRYGNDSTSAGGSDFSVSGVDSAITAFSDYGNSYSAAIAGYSYLDSQNSASIIGGMYNASLWGALGFNDGTNKWAGYFKGDGTNTAAFMNGRVGIGTTAPLATLDVRGNSATTPVASISGNTNFAGLVVDNSGHGDLITASSSAIGSNSQRTQFVVNNSGTVYGRAWTDLDNSSYYMDLNSAGYSLLTAGSVGIGTTSPSTTLHVKPTSGNSLVRIEAVSGSQAGLQLLSNDAATNTFISFGISGTVGNLGSIYGNSSDSSLRLTTGGSDRITILSAGNVGIGTTAPRGLLDVAGSGKYLITGNTGTYGSGGIVSGTEGTAILSNNTYLAAGASAWTSVDTSKTGALMEIYNQDILFRSSSTGASPTITNNLFIQGSTGNVGIGLTGPGNKLTIATAGTDDAIPALGANGGKLGLFRTDSNNGSYGMIMGELSSGNGFLQVQRVDGTATAYNMLLQPNGGNVGIGTTGPINRLTVATSATSPSSGIDSFGLVTTGSYGGGIGLQDGTGNFGIWTDGSGTNTNFGFGTSLGALSSVMSLNSSGNLTVTGVTNVNGGLVQDGNTILNGTDTWLRTTGNTGWYNATYTGGMYQTQVGRIDTYNNVGIYAVGPIISNGCMAIANGWNCGGQQLFVNGTAQISSGDNSQLILGPNATYAKYLWVGSSGSGNKATSTTGQVMMTNGNLHLDAANNSGNNHVYIGYYTASDTHINDNGGLVYLYVATNASTSLLCKSHSGGGSAYVLLCQNTLQVGDIAEDIIAPTAEAGDVVVIDPNGPNQTNIPMNRRMTYGAITSKPYDPNTLGIISTSGLVYFEKDLGPDSRPLTTSGVVPTKVTTINGKIHKGDAITTSQVPGAGMAATKAGPIVGKAEEDWDGSNATQSAQLVNGNWTTVNSPCQTGQTNCYNEDKILVLLTVAWSDPQVQLASTGDLNLVDQTATVDANFTVPHYFTLNDALGNPIDKVGAFSDAAIANLRAGGINAQQITTQALSIATENVTINGQSLKDYIASVVTSVLNSTNNNVVSPIASTDELHTNFISPVDNSANIGLKLDNNSLSVLNTDTASGSAVATIDNQGNASFSGQLTSNSLNTNDATVSGTLHVGKVIADQIEGLNVTASTVSAQYITNVTNVYNSTPSATDSNFGLIANAATPTNATSSSIFQQLAGLSASQYINLATYSSQLAYVDNLGAANAAFSQNLMVFGQTSLSDTSIIGQLSVDGNLILANESINVLGSDLNLQPLRQGGLSVMGGLFYIDTDGNVRVGGNADFAKNVTVGGTLATNIISPLSGSDLSLDTGSSNLRVNNASNAAVLSVNPAGDLVASGAGTFSKLNLNLVQPALAVSPTEVVATGSAGTTNIAAHQTQVTIDNPNVTAKSLIYITPTSSTNNQVLYLLKQVPNESFTVGLQNPSVAPIPFNWIIVN